MAAQGPSREQTDSVLEAMQQLLDHLAVVLLKRHPKQLRRILLGLLGPPIENYMNSEKGSALHSQMARHGTSWNGGAHATAVSCVALLRGGSAGV